VKADIRRSKPRLVLDQTICSDLSLSRSREWLETNGIGGYASSTITGRDGSRRTDSMAGKRTSRP